MFTVRKLSLVGMLLLILAASACGDAQPVRIGTEGAYPPFGYINDAGELEGFEIELGAEFCRRANLECTWVINDWESIIPNLQADKYDAIMAGMSITEERDRQIDFTEAYVPPEPSVYVALAGAEEEAIAGRVAVQTATVQAGYLAGKVADLVECDLAEETIEAVLSGAADSTFASHSYLKDIVAARGGQLDFVGPTLFLGQGTGVGVREGDEELRDTLNQAIGSMKEDGSLNNLIRKWLGEDEPTF
ncbi:MAG: transporter substrate-binding domain-containing protein [Chloroflexota bacterium]|nr:transporter substrate-binding domain-containing protein [Chloroflexota bacterium]